MRLARVRIDRHFAFALALALLAGRSAAQEACTKYEVRGGDTLLSIARAAYGSDDFQPIFDANRDLLAARLTALPTGLRLTLPCRDGQLTAEAELGAVIAAERAREPAIPEVEDPYRSPIRFVTADGWTPFVSRNLPGGGIFAQLATTAVRRGGNNRRFELAFVGDWLAHVNTLLPSGAFDISVVWTAPDCAAADGLDAFSARMCTEFEFSEPVYETVNGFYTLKGSVYAGADDLSDLAGARLCRPKSAPTVDLTRAGLHPPTVELVQPNRGADCARMLLDGEVDVYSHEIATLPAQFAALDAAERVEAIAQLATLTPRQLVVSRANPRSEDHIEMLNRGIAAMRDTGEWYDIVATGMAAYKASNP